MNENKYSKLSEEIINLLILKLSISDYMKVTKEISDLEMEIDRLTENNLSMQGEMARTWKKAEEKDKEIERLNSIIKEVREYIEKNTDNTNFLEVPSKELLEILDKVGDEV